ncbi:MAG: FAD-dependent monooxygenase [Bauldia sp.]|nr:FAD-dependent monooxygenase [Bauldia sp.]
MAPPAAGAHKPVHVAIVGGGPGGLALAQGLRKLGVDFAVFERDRARTDYVQGFRLGIRERGINALRKCLPDDLFEAFLATAGSAPKTALALDEKLEPVEGLEGWGRSSEDDLLSDRSVSRITLRQILLSGLDNRVHLGTAFSHYTANADGAITAHLEDGSRIDCNILVGADGANSRVRRQLLPDAVTFDTGVRRIAGKMTLAAAAHHAIPPLLTDNTVSILPRAGTDQLARSLFITAHRVNPDAYKRFGLIGADDPALAGFHFNNTTSYVWWNTAYWQDELASDAELAEATPSDLLDLLLDRLGGWHPDLVKLVNHTDPSTVALLKVRSSRPVDPWPTGKVTLLGDAIHSMTYFRALGGNTALYDAGLLVDEFAAVAAGRKSEPEALAAYEAAMLPHGFEAVRTSLTNMERALGPPAQAAA